MNPKLATSKLAALRLKTDRQLVIFIQNRLDDATHFARLEDPKSHLLAQQIHGEVRELLPLVDGLSRSERRTLETRLASLAQSIDEPESPRVLTMCR